MGLPLKDEDIKNLRDFIDVVKEQPSILNEPRLGFFKSFIEDLGGRIPQSFAGKNEKTQSHEPEVKEEVKPESESEESDVELDMTGVLEPDTDAPQPMGDVSKEPTEEELDKSNELRKQAMEAFNMQDYQKAVETYTEAIILNPQGSMLYAKRGQAYLFLKKPNACIRDCERALELNPDSAAAHKFRGRAYQYLGKWEEAATDLRTACKFDFDEQVDEWLKEVLPNALKIEEHNRKKARKLSEKQEKERQEHIRRAREAAAKVREESSRTAPPENASAPGFGDLPQFLNDPEVLQAFKDPEIMMAFTDISSNPANIFKYQSNPKVMVLIKKMADKFGGPAGMAGMMGGGMPGAGFPEGFPTSTSEPTKPSGNFNDDVGLD